MIQLGEELQPWVGSKCKYLDRVEMFNPRTNTKNLEKGIFFLHPTLLPVNIQDSGREELPFFSRSCWAGSVPLFHCHNYSLNPIIPEIVIPKSTFLNWKEIFGLFSLWEILSCRIFLGLGQSWNHEGWRRPPGTSIPTFNQFPTKPYPKVPYPLFFKKFQA